MATPNPTIAAMLAAKAASKAKPAAAPAKPDRPALVWESIEPASLPAEMAELYYAIGKARSAFEAAMSTMLEPPAHLKLAFAYKRGLAIALAPKASESSGLAALMARLTEAE